MLKNKIAFITGAASGIGRAICITLAKYGADIAAADINVKGLEETVEKVNQLGRRCSLIELDICNKKRVEKSVQSVIDEYGTIDIFVNSVGTLHASMIIDLEEDVWDKVMDVNVKGVMLVSQAVAREMISKRYGKIINISSMVSKIGEVGNGVYCVSKAAVNMFTQVLAMELAQYNINVNAVCPGHTDTELLNSVFETRGPLMGLSAQELKEELISSVPLKRLAEPEDIAELVAFLVSDKSSYITGIPIVIGGGKISI